MIMAQDVESVGMATQLLGRLFGAQHLSFKHRREFDVV